MELDDVEAFRLDVACYPSDDFDVIPPITTGEVPGVKTERH